MDKEKEGFIIKVLNIIIKHWWKVLILMITAGAMIIGFKCQYKDIKIEKDSIYKYSNGNEK